MANIKELNRKISALKNMQKLMRAMNMIASIKLRKLLHFQSPLQLFAKSLATMAHNIVDAFNDTGHPLITGYKQTKKAHIIIFTADKGLCGKHNNSIQKAASACIEKKQTEGITVDVTCIGTKGATYCLRKGYPVYQQTEINDRALSMDALKGIAAKALQQYLDGSIQQLVVINNNFISTLQQETETTQLLPFPITLKADEKREILNASTEPVEEEFISVAAELFLFYKLRAALVNSLLSEQAARMTAMENATNNSEDLISRYGRVKNRARQATITNELIEIISGKEAMKR
jgi:F-type H+-transporting ATPase subunit gamma